MCLLLNKLSKINLLPSSVQWASFVFCKWPIEGYSCTIRLSFGMQPGHNHPCIGGCAEVRLFSTWGRGTIWGQEVQNMLQCPASAKIWLYLNICLVLLPSFVNINVIKFSNLLRFKEEDLFYKECNTSIAMSVYWMILIGAWLIWLLLFMLLTQNILRWEMKKIIWWQLTTWQQFVSSKVWDKLDWTVEISTPHGCR